MQSRKTTKNKTKQSKQHRLRGSTIFFLLLLLACAVLFALPQGLQKIDSQTHPRKYNELVEKYAAEYEIDPLIIYSIIRTESGFDPNAQSNVDARGLMQITEETFAWIKLKIASGEDISFDQLYDPEVNVRFGAYFLSRCLARYGDVSTAAAAYHSGWGTVDKLLAEERYAQDAHTLKEFPYTQMNLYVYKVGRAYQKYTELYGAETNRLITFSSTPPVAK